MRRYSSLAAVACCFGGCTIGANCVYVAPNSCLCIDPTVRVVVLLTRCNLLFGVHTCLVHDFACVDLFVAVSEPPLDEPKQRVRDHVFVG